MDEIVKTCGCGRIYTRAEWQNLHYVGRQHLVPGWSLLEIRLCLCGTSFAIKLRRGETLTDHLSHLRDKAPNKRGIRHAHGRGICPHCGRPLRVLRRISPTALEAGCSPCGHAIEARRGGILYRLLTETEEVEQ